MTEILLIFDSVPKMTVIELRSWLEFENHLREVNCRREELESKNDRSFPVPLFRGLGSGDWDLKTTLERAWPLESSVETKDLQVYYQKVYASKSAIETLTEREWEDLPEPLDFKDLLTKYSSFPPQHFFGRNISIYKYLIYLRHHGFPSPFLDWTASPYVAAFFAFDGIAENTGHVAVYAMLRDSLSSLHSEGTPYLTVLGPHVRSHRRHLIQQSQYSVCLEWSPTYTFHSHEDVLKSDGTLGSAGELIKLNIPVSERTAALKSLDLMNINAFSLFGSEDSLVRTISRRELLLRPSIIRVPRAATP